MTKIIKKTCVVENFSCRHRREFRRDIQGVRAIAVMAVIVFHACITCLPSGLVGVEVFFVISACIVTSLIIDGHSQFNWLDFYWGRLKRNVPAYVVMIASVAVVASLLFLDGDFDFYKKSVESSLFVLSNHYFSDFGSYFGPRAYELPLLHTWSLAIEMQICVLLSVFIWLTPRNWLPWWMGIICVLLLVYSQWQLGLQDSLREVYFAFYSRIQEFIIGVLVAFAGLGENGSSKVSLYTSWIGLLVLLVSFSVVGQKNFPSLASAIPCMATAPLIASKKCVVTRLLSTRALVWVGALSYSLYLWYWPILALIRYYVGNYELTTPWLLGFFLVTFLLSWLSYHFVEALPRNSMSIFAKPVNVCARVTITGAARLGSTPLQAIVEKPMPVEFTQYAPASNVCHGQIISNCLLGDLTQTLPILVLGDSHTARLNEFFDVAGKQNKFAARIMSAGICLPIPGFDVARISDYSRADSRAQMAALVPYLDSIGISVVAAMWQWQLPSKQFMLAPDEFISFVTKRDAKVVVLAQAPMFEVKRLRVRRFLALGMSVDVYQNKDRKKANSDISVLVSSYKNETFVEFSNSQFFAEPPFREEQLIYMDNHRLNEIGSYSNWLFIAPFLQKNLVSIH